MDADLEPVFAQVMNAARPEDMFRELNLVLPQQFLKKHLQEEVDEFLKVLDPALYSAPADIEAAEQALYKFNEHYDSALKKASKGLYALDGFSQLPISENGKEVLVDDVTYTIGQKIHSNEYSSLFSARFPCDGGGAKAAIRVAHNSSTNLFLNNEIRILDRLHRKVADIELPYWRYLPYVLGRFRAGERIGVVYRWFEGITAADIRRNALHSSGLDQRHMIWIFDRMINLLGYVHNRGVVHGRIEPKRLLVRPSNHNVMLTGWSHSVYKPGITGEQMAAAEQNPFVAPEVHFTGEVGPWTDIYSLGKSMIWLLGGNPSTNEIPDTVHIKVQRFLLNMVREKPQARPSDAWQLYKAQTRLKDTLWERRFLHLDLV